MRYESIKPIKSKLTYRQASNQPKGLRLNDWLIFRICRENCPTGIIPEWMQKVTQHNGVMIQVHKSTRSAWSCWIWQNFWLEDHSKFEQRTIFHNGILNRRCRFNLVSLDSINAVFWYGYVLQTEKISKICSSWYSKSSILESVFFSLKSSLRSVSFSGGDSYILVKIPHRLNPRLKFQTTSSIQKPITKFFVLHSILKLVPKLKKFFYFRAWLFRFKGHL